MTVRAGPSEQNAIVQANEVTADRVDPEQEPAFGAGRLRSRQRPGRSRQPMQARIGCGDTPAAAAFLIASTSWPTARLPGSRFDPPLSQTIPSAGFGRGCG